MKGPEKHPEEEWIFEYREIEGAIPSPPPLFPPLSSFPLPPSSVSPFFLLTAAKSIPEFAV